MPAPRSTNQTSGVPARFSSVRTVSSSFFTNATSWEMPARARASEAMAPPVMPSVSMWVTIRTEAATRTRSAICWATASMHPPSGCRSHESLGGDGGTAESFLRSPREKNGYLRSALVTRDPHHRDGPDRSRRPRAPGKTNERGSVRRDVGCVRWPPRSLRRARHGADAGTGGRARDQSLRSEVPWDIRGHRPDVEGFVSSLPVLRRPVGREAAHRERRAFRNSLVRAGANRLARCRTIDQGRDPPGPADETLTERYACKSRELSHGRRHSDSGHPCGHQDDCGRRLLERSREGRAPRPEVHADERLSDHPREPDRNRNSRRESVSVARRRPDSVRRGRHLSPLGGCAADCGAGHPRSRKGDLDAAGDPERRRREEGAGLRKDRGPGPLYDARPRAPIRPENPRLTRPRTRARRSGLQLAVPLPRAPQSLQGRSSLRVVRRTSRCRPLHTRSGVSTRERFRRGRARRYPARA